MDSKVLERLRLRFFRKTIGHPDGAIVHHGDCHFYTIDICTCGLLHDLLPHLATMPKVADEHYPRFWTEFDRHESAIGLLQGQKFRTG